MAAREMPVVAWLGGCGADSFGELFLYLKTQCEYFRTRWTRARAENFAYLL